MRPVAARIAQAGGEVLHAAWIDQTVRARVPAGALPRLADVDEVASIDLPRPLHGPG